MSFTTKYIQLNNKTAGKDKIYRTVQYGCKFVWYILWKTKSNKEYIEILKRLEALMSSTRKVLRFGKTYDMIDSSLKSIHIDDNFLRYTITASSLNQALYLIFDNLLLLNQIGFIKLEKKADKFSEWSNKFWLMSTVLFLSRDFYEIIIQLEQQLHNINSRSSNSRKQMKASRKALLVLLSTLNHLHLLCKNNPNLMLDTIKNACDLVLPMASLKFIDVSPGVQGACGLVSSIISLLVVWDAKYKLMP